MGANYTRRHHPVGHETGADMLSRTNEVTGDRRGQLGDSVLRCRHRQSFGRGRDLMANTAGSERATWATASHTRRVVSFVGSTALRRSVNGNGVRRTAVPGWADVVKGDKGWGDSGMTGVRWEGNAAWRSLDKIEMRGGRDQGGLGWSVPRRRHPEAAEGVGSVPSQVWAWAARRGEDRPRGLCPCCTRSWANEPSMSFWFPCSRQLRCHNSRWEV